MKQDMQSTVTNDKSGISSRAPESLYHEITAVESTFNAEGGRFFKPDGSAKSLIHTMALHHETIKADPVLLAHCTGLIKAVVRGFLVRSQDIVMDLERSLEIIKPLKEKYPEIVGEVKREFKLIEMKSEEMKDRLQEIQNAPVGTKIIITQNNKEVIVSIYVSAISLLVDNIRRVVDDVRIGLGGTGWTITQKGNADDTLVSLQMYVDGAAGVKLCVNSSAPSNSALSHSSSSLANMNLESPTSSAIIASHGTQLPNSNTELIEQQRKDQGQDSGFGR